MPDAAQLVLDQLADAGALLHDDQACAAQLVERDGLARRTDARAGRRGSPRRGRTARRRRRGGAGPRRRRRARARAPATRSTIVCVSKTQSTTWSSGWQPWNSQRSCERTIPPGPVEAPISNVPASSPLASSADLGDDLLLEREQSLGAAVEPHARLGRLDPPARAVEELRAEPLLERPDLQADRRLGDPEPLRGLGEAAPLDDGAERGELARVHKPLYLSHLSRSERVGRTGVDARSASSERIAAEDSRGDAFEPDVPRCERSATPTSARAGRNRPPHADRGLELSSDHRRDARAQLAADDRTRSSGYTATRRPRHRGARIDVELRGRSTSAPPRRSSRSSSCSAGRRLIALLLLATSGRPVLYRGQRVGRGGRFFTMLKFRTLTRDAEARLGPYLGEELVRRTEAEYTRFGRWLKASQLDEIPQLWNVLRGDMSFVGPAPDPGPLLRGARHRPPGVLAAARRPPRPHGLAQVRRGYETSMAEKLAHDLEWIADRSVPLYLRTLAIDRRAGAPPDVPRAATARPLRGFPARARRFPRVRPGRASVPAGCRGSTRATAAGRPVASVTPAVAVRSSSWRPRAGRGEALAVRRELDAARPAGRSGQPRGDEP